MKTLLVTIDAWRASHASFMPAVEESYTPAMESLAEEGVAFSQAVSHGPATPYAFPALFTSTLPLDHGGYERLSEERTLVSEALSAAGHRCVGIHANPWLGEKYGYGRGYDRYVDVGEFGLPLLERIREGLIDRFGLDHPVYRAAQSAYRAAQGPLKTVSGGTEGEVDAAREVLAASDPEGDLFVWTHLLAPHAPYAPPERYREEMDVPDFEGSATALVTRAQRDPESLAPDERRAIELLYAASVRHADAQVERLLEVTDDDTLIVVTADHGEALFQHGQLGHEPCLYDELVHVPLLVRPPADAPSGTEVVEAQVQHLDVAPTILDYAGVDPPGTYRGRSLRPAIEGGELDDGGRPAVMEVASTPEKPGRLDAEALQVGVRRPERKLLADDGDVLGYDLVADPDESDPRPDPEDGDWEALRTELHDRLDALEFDTTDHVERDEDVERRLRDLGYME